MDESQEENDKKVMAVLALLKGHKYTVAKYILEQSLSMLDTQSIVK